MEDAITKFSRKGVELYLRAYIEKCISFALFRVPEFRTEFVDCILSKSNTHIDEWSNMAFNIDAHREEEDYNPSLSQYFDWNEYFYS